MLNARVQALLELTREQVRLCSFVSSRLRRVPFCVDFELLGIVGPSCVNRRTHFLMVSFKELSHSPESIGQDKISLRMGIFDHRPCPSEVSSRLEQIDQSQAMQMDQARAPPDGLSVCDLSDPPRFQPGARASGPAAPHASCLA